VGALRRVATLVARGMSAAEIFAAVAEEAGRLLDADLAHMLRYKPDGTVTVVVGWSPAGDHLPIGSRQTLEGQSASAIVSRTGRPARIDSYTGAAGSLAARVRRLGVRSTVGYSITVEGRLWGLIAINSTQPEPLPADTEARIAGFAELAATAIANTQARAELAASRARRAGWAPALKALARRSAVPVELDLHVRVRPLAPVEVAAYYAASEALTNAASTPTPRSSTSTSGPAPAACAVGR
jgi:GAF domain-containing protein